MRIRFLLLLLFISPGAIHAQSKMSLQKAWVGPEAEYVDFDSTRCVFDFFGRRSSRLFYNADGDTLRFYYQYKDNHTKGNSSDFRFLITKLTADSLILTPADAAAIKMVRGQPSLRYRSQTMTSTDTIHFDSLYFKSTNCYGKCPAMEFQVSKNGQIKFVGGSYAIKEGYYTGTLSKSDYRNLYYTLSISSLDKLKTWPQRIFDVPKYTVIVWYNNKRMYIENYELPLVMRQLIVYLLTLPNRVDLQKSRHPFTLVNPDTFAGK